MTKELLNKAINRIKSKLFKSEKVRYNRLWDCYKAEFVFGNGRKATVRKLIPNKSTNFSKYAETYYTIEYVGFSGGHFTLEEVAEKLYEAGIENVDPFKNGVNTKMLKDLGFEQVERLQEPNIKDIGYYLEEGFYQYKFELDEEHTYYGQEYDTGTTPYYYGSRYRDILKKEYLYVRHSDSDNWYKALYRYIKVGSQCVSNYVED